MRCLRRMRQRGGVPALIVLNTKESPWKNYTMDSLVDFMS